MPADLDHLVAEWSPEALDELRERAAIIWEGVFRCDPESWPEAQRMAVRCVRLRVDRESRVIYPALSARAAPR